MIAIGPEVEPTSDISLSNVDQDCTVKNATVMVCTMPEVVLPSDFTVNGTIDHHVSVAAGGGVLLLRGGPNDRDRASIYIGLEFDGFDDYTNLTAAKPEVKFQFYLQPTFDVLTDPIVYRPNLFNDIDIRVIPSMFFQRNARHFNSFFSRLVHIRSNCAHYACDTHSFTVVCFVCLDKIIL